MGLKTALYRFSPKCQKDMECLNEFELVLSYTLASKDCKDQLRDLLDGIDVNVSKIDGYIMSAECRYKHKDVYEAMCRIEKNDIPMNVEITKCISSYFKEVIEAVNSVSFNINDFEVYIEQCKQVVSNIYLRKFTDNVVIHLSELAASILQLHIN